MRISEIISYNIKTRRKELKISQSSLAEKTDLSPGMIAGIEICKVTPSMESLDKIAVALHLKPYQLLMDDEDKKPFNQREFQNEVETILRQELKRFETAFTDRLYNLRNN